jgi:thiol:disulfide interchange protein DsbD
MQSRSGLGAWASSLLRLIIAFVLCSPLALAINPEDLLEPDKAFRFSARAVEGGQVEVSYRIAPGYYLYRDRFKFEAEPPSVVLGAAQFPAGQIHEDKFFGRQEIYRGELRILVPASGGERFRLVVTSQGCADAGICYVPHRQTAAINLSDTTGKTGPSLRDRLEAAAPQADAGGSGVRWGLDASDIDIARLLEESSFWLVIGSFFVFGLLLSFTPCMLPMIPILSGIIVGQGGGGDKRRALILSIAYVLGMALAYAAAGMTAAWSGSLLAAALQNAAVLIGFALVFVVLALSMFGLFELQLPGFIRHRLHDAHQQLSGGRIASVAAMGLFSAIIVSPCVAAPLAGALLYISQSRDLVLGGTALFVMALGMGVPLVVMGVSEGAFLPRTGHWMKLIRQFFGLLLLAVAVWIISPLVSVSLQMGAWGSMLIVMALLLKAIDPLPARAGTAPRVAKALGLIVLLAGTAMLVGVMTGSRDPLRPLHHLFSESAGEAAPLRFERVNSIAELDARLKTAGQPVMLDFYADWCVTCKEMERYTFTDVRVQERLGNVLLLQADVTANTEAHRALLKRFRLFGPPGIVFFDADGREVPGLRVIGYQSAETFLRSLDRLPR